MSTEENKTLVRRAYEEGLNQQNLAVFDELCAPEFVLHNAPMTIQGREAYNQFVSLYFAAFPDVHFIVEDLIAEGDTVVARHTFRGTHKGELMGIPPTGKQVSVTGMTITRLRNGKAVEQWLNFDALGMLQQLGVVPEPGRAS